MSSAPLSFADHLTGRRVSLALVAYGKLQSPAQLRAQIKRPLELIKSEARFFAHHRRQQALPPLGCVVAECSPCGRVRRMFPCVATACRRLVTAPAGVRVISRTTGRWAAWIMERVTRCRVRRVQVRLHRRACCAVRCACRHDVPVLACAVRLTRAAGNGGWL